MMKISAPTVMEGVSLVEPLEIDDPQRVLLIILDGWGEGQQDATNPIFLAKTPRWDQLIKDDPPIFLHASGTSVGLQEGKAGNSEAGHINIGAGRVVLQDDVRLDQSMNDGSFSANAVFQKAMDHVLQEKSNLHLLAFLSEKSSHGSIAYPLALLEIAKKNGLKDVFIHVIFDGRSTEPGSAPALLEKLENAVNEIGIGQIVTGVGRGIALDRDGNYEKIKKTYQALVDGIGRSYSCEDADENDES
jgi:2,3-bisphosphoglycerate-independent phosphoglycerate mutase